MGFTEAALYRHFIGKDEIITGLISLVNFELNSEFSKIDPFLNAIDQYKVFVDLFFSYSNRNMKFVSILHSKIFYFEPKYKGQSLNLKEKVHSRLEEVIEMGQNEKVFRKDLPANIMADYILGAIDNEMNNWTTSHFNNSITERGQLLSDRFLLLIKTKPNEN